MAQTWNNYIKEAMKERGITQKELADELGISIHHLRNTLFEQERVTLDQLAKLVELLQLDLNEMLEISLGDHDDLLLEEDVQVRLNTIARSIPQKNRSRFLKAVKYLAQCFDEKK